MRRSSFIACFASGLLASLANAEVIARKAPKEGGLVNQSKTAIAIATAVAIEAYGKDAIESQLPLIATDMKQYWKITGQLPKGVPGGVVEILISKLDAQILQMEHGK